MVTYKTERGYQDVWTKREFISQRDARIDKLTVIPRNSTYVKEKAIAYNNGKKYYDVTNKWKSNKYVVKNNVEIANSIRIGKTVYNVDGKDIQQNHKINEKEVAKALTNIFGGKIHILPEVNEPKYTSVADYDWIRKLNGEHELWDLKTINGNGKSVIYGAIHKKRRQAKRFVVYIGEKCELGISEIEKQIGDVFDSDHTSFVDNIILMFGNTVKVYERI